MIQHITRGESRKKKTTTTKFQIKIPNVKRERIENKDILTVSLYI